MNRYTLQQSTTQPNGWVVTDTHHGIVLQFTEGAFYESQKVTLLEDRPTVEYMQLAKAMRELGDWVVMHHSSIAFRRVHCFEWSEDFSELRLVRAKQPRFVIRVLRGVSPRELKHILRGFADSPFVVGLQPEQSLKDDCTFVLEAVDAIGESKIRSLIIKAAAFIKE